jgi:hypothetical protein
MYKKINFFLKSVFFLVFLKEALMIMLFYTFQAGGCNQYAQLTLFLLAGCAAGVIFFHGGEVSGVRGS